MKATEEMMGAVIAAIWEHGKRLAEHDLTISDKERKWIGGEPEIRIGDGGIQLYYWEHWGYGGEESHLFNMEPSEVFADDPLAPILARSAALQAKRDKEARAASSAAKKAAVTAAKNREEQDRAEFERLSKKFGR